jgi:hypothetical protein
MSNQVTLGPINFQNPVLDGNHYSKYWQSLWSSLGAILFRVQPMVQNQAFFIALDQVPIYANNAAAIADGKVPGNLYRNGANPDHVCIVH